MKSETPGPKNGQQIGQEYAAMLEVYLQALRVEGKGLPSRDGKVSMTAIAMAAGVNRQSLYKNPHCRAQIEAVAQELGLSSIEARRDAPTRDDGKDQRIHFLESQVASLQAEVHGLRSQLAQLRQIEAHLVETGRRVIP